jgi:hypothetical protein
MRGDEAFGLPSEIIRALPRGAHTLASSYLKVILLSSLAVLLLKTYS